MRTLKTMLCLVVLLVVAMGVGFADGIPIDIELPEVTSTPLPFPIYYEFRTSWDGIQWTQEQKDSARGALEYFGSFFATQPVFQELDTPDDFSIRWAGRDFFQNYGKGKLGGKDVDLNLTNALAVAAKTGLEPPELWDQTKYPIGEIYFNTAYNWHFNPFTAPEEGDPNDDGDGEFDFWSVFLHETIHMMCVNYHAEHPDEVMYAYFSDGEQRYQLKDSDWELLRRGGYTIPEPASITILVAGLGAMALKRRRCGLD